MAARSAFGVKVPPIAMLIFTFFLVRSTLGAPTTDKTCPINYYFDHGTEHCEHCCDICCHMKARGTEEDCMTLCPAYAKSLETKVLPAPQDSDGKAQASKDPSAPSGLAGGTIAAIVSVAVVAVFAVAVSAVFITRHILLRLNRPENEAGRERAADGAEMQPLNPDPPRRGVQEQGGDEPSSGGPEDQRLMPSGSEEAGPSQSPPRIQQETPSGYKGSYALACPGDGNRESKLDQDNMVPKSYCPPRGTVVPSGQPFQYPSNPESDSATQSQEL